MTDHVHRMNQASEPASARPDAQPPARRLRCLLVEDSSFDRSLIHYSAERAGIEIEFVDASTLAEARASLAAHDFELVILDRRLPDGDGLDLARQLRGGVRNADVPSIMLSGGDADELAPASAVAGCVAFIAKQDLSPEGLAGAVRRALGNAGAVEPSEELRLLLGALSDFSRIARMKPLASRLMTVVSELRRSPADDGTASAALEEMSELSLMLWLELDAADREVPAQADTAQGQPDAAMAAPLRREPGAVTSA